MANILAPFSVCEGLRLFFQRAYDNAEQQPAPGIQFEVASANQIDRQAGDSPRDVLFIFLHRISPNHQLRQPALKPQGEPAPLLVDLHLLLIARCSHARTEQSVLTWAMRELHQCPVLNPSVLSPEAGWEPEESVQITPSELGNEELMRLCSAVLPSHHLSIPYIARMVRVDATPTKRL